MKYSSLKTFGKTAPWCVDGRPDYNASKGPQMLGGSLHPVVLFALISNKPLTKDFYTAQFSFLKKSGFNLGTHRGAHKKPKENRSDCGFSDRMADVFKKAKSQQDEIIRRLLEINALHQEVFGDTENVRFLLEKTFKSIHAYSDDLVGISGDELIHHSQKAGALTINLAGDHGEQAAFVNLKENTTLDTNGLNKEGKQAFNLDLWSAVKQAHTLGVEAGFATAASLILYMATEMVLVEDKGKNALPVFINR